MKANLNSKDCKKLIHFDVAVNTMNDGSKRSILKGDTLAVVKLPKRKWKSEFKKGGVFVIFDMKLGIILREVTNYSVETNEITCHTWNSDEGCPDITLNLDSIIVVQTIETISRNLEENSRKRA